MTLTSSCQPEDGCTILALKHDLFRLAFAGIAASGLHRAAASRLRGLGAILMLHHVRPFEHGGFAPNRLLEVTPQFLDSALTRAVALGFQFASLEDVVAQVRHGSDGPPLLAVTFDDGYVDNLEHALPVLRRHGVPATVFVTPGFAERTATLWWLDLEHAIAASSEMIVDIGAGEERLPCADDAQRTAAFERIYWSLRTGPEERLRSAIALLAARAGVDTQATVGRLCLDWAGLAQLAADPLVSIGAHTMTHPMLAKHDAAVMRSEMAQSRNAIVERLGVPVRHFAYPVGDPGSAGPREFAMAAELGFEAAVTTRPGMLFPVHAERLTALPRVSLNGHFQDPAQFEVLLSGLPFWLWNGGRSVAAA